MSAENNPFLNGEYNRGGGPSQDPDFMMPPFPFMSAGDPANLQAAQNVSGWLRELAETGTENQQADVVSSFQMSSFPELMADLSSVAEPDLRLPTFPEAANPEVGRTNKELLLGAAAIYGWQDPGFKSN
jgi:hypothetical protein